MNTRRLAKALAAGAVGACAFAVVRELLRPAASRATRSRDLAVPPAPAARAAALRVGLYTVGGIVAGACLKGNNGH